MRSGILEPKTDPSAPVQQEDIQTSTNVAIPPKYTDAATLSIITGDRETAAAWLRDHRWPMQWHESDILYQSPKGYAVFEGSNVTRSNISDFTVAKQVNSLAPAMKQAVFPGSSAPMTIRPLPNTSQKSARAWGALLGALLDEIEFKTEIDTGIESQVGLGTVIFKCGWETTTKVETHMVRKAAPAAVQLPFQQQPMMVVTAESDEFDAEDIEVTRNRPFFEKCELGTVFVDPKWNKPNQIGKSKWIIEEYYVTYEDLCQLRKNPDYDIPSDEILRGALSPTGETPAAPSGAADAFDSNGATHHAESQDDVTSEDPLMKPLQILERWTDDMCQVSLQGKIVIRNKPHNLPGKPYFSANFWNMYNAGYGMGVGRLSGSSQRVKQGAKNAGLDILSLAVQPDYIVARGANAPTQAMRQRLAGITMVDGDPSKAFALKEQPRVPPEVWTTLQIEDQAADSTVGADQANVQGTLPGRGSSVGRTAQGSAGMQRAANGRIQAPVDKLVDGVILPFVKFLWAMVRERMPTSEIREILGQEMTADLLPDMYDFMNAKLKFDVVAGTRLAARAAMAQALPFMLQVFENPEITKQLNATGEKIDYREVFAMVLDVSEWRNNRALIVPLSPQELQMQQTQNAQIQKLQGQIALLQQKHQNDSELEDQKIQGRIAGKLITDSAGAPKQNDVLNRADNFASRDQIEHTVQASPYFAGA
jgi:hypothetical protein